MNCGIKEICEPIIENMIAVSEDIYKHPELGFKENRTAEKVAQLLREYQIPYRDGIACTGIVSTLDSGKPGPHIGMICELDAVPTLNHPYANPVDNAAHTCGHYAQIGVMMSAFLTLIKSAILQKLCGKVSLIVTPSEEYCDLDYRRQLIQEGKVRHFSGKQEMIHLGVFDDIDLMLSCHTTGLDMKQYDAEIGASLNGFLCKRATFYGKGAHAGSNPAGGINALNAASLAMTAINFLRETFREEDAIRVHFILSEGGQTVNSIPERTAMDMYVRAKTVEAIEATNRKVNRALRSGALAIGCDLEIRDQAGYLPLHQDVNLSQFMRKYIGRYIKEDRIAQGTHGYASGDMGDISTLIPTVEIGIGGFTGTMHGNDFRTDNFDQAYRIPAKYFVDAVIGLLENSGAEAYVVKSQFHPLLTKELYLTTLDKFNKTEYYKKEQNQ